MAYVNREPKTSISVTSAWDNSVINYSDNVSVVGSKYKDTIENGGDYDDSDAEKGGDNVSINGGAGDDTIDNGGHHSGYFGYGGNNVTMLGGTGNDYLWGDADADKFICATGDGKDTIYGFDDKDTLTLDGLDFTSSYKKGIVSLKFADGGSISFKNFTATTFHIDNDTYKISGSKFKKQQHLRGNKKIPDGRLTAGDNFFPVTIRQKIFS